MVLLPSLTDVAQQPTRNRYQSALTRAIIQGRGLSLCLNGALP